MRKSLSDQLRALADEAEQGELSKASLARLKRIIAPKKKSKRQTKPRGTKPRKVKPQPERLPALLAIEVRSNWWVRVNPERALL